MIARQRVSTGQAVEKIKLLNRLQGLSLRTRIIGGVVLALVLLLLISIPGDRTELLARQVKVEAAQVGYELVLPAVAPIMQNVIAAIEETGVDLSGNRTFTGLSGNLTTYNRDNATVASRFQAILTFSNNVHTLLDGTNAVPELDTAEFRTLVAEMDTTLSVAWSAMMDLNDAVDEYNGYQRWISASLATMLFGLPQGYDDPLPATTRLNRESLVQ